LAHQPLLLVIFLATALPVLCRLPEENKSIKSACYWLSSGARNVARQVLPGSFEPASRDAAARWALE